MTGISWSLKTSPPARLREQWEGGKGFFWNLMVNLESEIMDIGYWGWVFFLSKTGYEKYEKEGKGKSQSDFLIRHIYLPVLTKLTFSSGFSAGPSEVRSS